FVLRWWHHAAELVRDGKSRAFGFITSNSIRQVYNRRVLEPFLQDSIRPLSLSFAIPDHPWVDAQDGAAVRIAMTSGVAAPLLAGQLQVVMAEHVHSDNEDRVERMKAFDG